MEEKERQWIEKLRSGSEQAFKEMFSAYYAKLCGFAADYVNSVDLARDIVQDVFLKIWERRENLNVRTSLKSYLYQAVRNRALNEVRRDNTKDEVETYLEHITEDKNRRTAENVFQMKGLSKDVEKAISNLPDRRRMAFLLHRRHGFTYKEVAQIMDISPKTVENQIGRALKSLRNQLVDKFSREVN